MGDEINADLDPAAAAAIRFQRDHPAGGKKAKLEDALGAGAAHPGWAASSMNATCVYNWEVRLRQLGRAAEEAADGVTKSMDIYLTADTTAAGELRRNAQWLEGA
ncbi:hypothetical protein [Amycolatopsis samaneae]|uniref:Excreted virulence factor EspC, type VII ESX diderm n=1 Tax=Amycolatopsis samaneae TaxID=664691 RepID=A0ABW5GQY1_9PSEU